MLDRRNLLTGMALGAGGGVRAPLRLRAGETATLPFGHGARAPVAYPGKRPLLQMAAHLGAAY